MHIDSSIKPQYNLCKKEKEMNSKYFFATIKNTYIIIIKRGYGNSHWHICKIFFFSF